MDNIIIIIQDKDIKLNINYIHNQYKSKPVFYEHTISLC